MVKCESADRYGNLIYHATARNFGPIMCTASDTAIIQAKNIVKIGELDPENIITPGIFVNKVVEVSSPVHESELVLNKERYPC